MASALARLTELKELELYLQYNQIGRGPRRHSAQTRMKSKPESRSCLGRRIIVPLALATRGRRVAAWGLTSLSQKVMQAPQLWLRACGICGSSGRSMLGWQTTRSARSSRSVQRTYRPCHTNQVQAIKALDPCSQ